MTYYHQQVLRIREQVYPKEDLCEQIMQAKIFIDNHYHTNIHLQQIARKAFISRFHFIRLFKNNYGRTPGKYLTEVRITKAKKMLQSGESVAEVCFAVGFSSTTSFCGLFKKITGLTPSAFQKNRKKSNSQEI